MKWLRQVFDFLLPLPHIKIERARRGFIISTAPKIRIEAITNVGTKKCWACGEDEIHIERRFLTLRAFIVHYAHSFAKSFLPAQKGGSFSIWQELFSMSNLELRRGAIAYDTHTSNTGTSFSHTVTGASPTIVVMTGSVNIAAGTTATYNGVSLTERFRATPDSGSANLTCLYLGGCATGANTVALTGNTNSPVTSVVSFSGTNTGSPVDTSNSGTGTNAASDSPHQVAVTTTKNNSFIFVADAGHQASGTITPSNSGAGQTERAANVFNSPMRLESATEQKVTAGAETMEISWSGTSSSFNKWAIGAIAIQEGASFKPKVTIIF